MILATGNKHKVREMRELLPGLDLPPLPAGVEMPPEDERTYSELSQTEKNAISHRGRAAKLLAEHLAAAG